MFLSVETAQNSLFLNYSGTEKKTFQCSEVCAVMTDRALLHNIR